MAYPRGIEPLTSWSVAKRSIRLSYGYADVIEDEGHFIINERGMQLFVNGPAAFLIAFRFLPAGEKGCVNIGLRQLTSHGGVLFGCRAEMWVHDLAYGPAQSGAVNRFFDKQGNNARGIHNRFVLRPCKAAALQENDIGH